MRSYEDLTGQLFGGTVRVMEFKGSNPVCWQVVCQSCKSSWVEQHHILTRGDYKCRNTACQLGRVRPRPEAIEEDGPSLVSVYDHSPKESSEYLRYKAYLLSLGYKEQEMASYSDFEQLTPENLRRIMAPVKQWAKEVQKKRDDEIFAQNVQAGEMERIRRTYGV